MTDLTTLSNEDLAEHIGSGLREAERRTKDENSEFDEATRNEVLTELEAAHGHLLEAETIVMNAGGVSARSGGDKTP